MRCLYTIGAVSQHCAYRGQHKTHFWTRGKYTYNCPGICADRYPPMGEPCP